MKYYYPAIFEPKKSGKGFVVTVPDIQGCFTQGDDIPECMYMAHEAIGCLLEDVDEEDYPASSSINDIDLSEFEKGSFATLVMFDKEKYDIDTAANLKNLSVSNKIFLKGSGNFAIEEKTSHI